MARKFEEDLANKEPGLERFTDYFPHFRQVVGDDPETFEQIYSYLSEPENIWHMINSIENRKSALSGVVADLEEKFEEKYDFDEPVKRRIIGAMIREIITDFGYRPGAPSKQQEGGDNETSAKSPSQQVSVAESRKFKTGSRYTYYPKFARKKIAVTYRIKDV